MQEEFRSSNSSDFEIPVRRALSVPILIGGVPRELAIVNGTLTFAFLFALHSLWILLISFFVHYASLRLTKSDPDFMRVFKRNLNQKNYYE